jgi:uncharacterized protein (TIGR02284 family)
MSATNTSEIEQLNGLLRGEISAVETYDQALAKLADDPAVAVDLRACRSSHQARVYSLRSEVRRLGGEPVDGSGVWGTFAKLVEGGAKMFGTKAAIAALEQGEDKGMNDYLEERDSLAPAVRTFVEREIASEQKRTHATIARLKERV